MNEIRYQTISKLPDVPKDSLLRQYCYLCRSFLDKPTDEHVIPRVIFRLYPESADVATSTLLKLWACADCNSKKGSNEDSITRDLQVTSTTPPARRGFDRLVKSASKNGQGKHLLRKIADRFQRREVSTALGKSLGVKPVISMGDENLLEAYFVNIAKGLFVRNTLTLYDWNDYEVFFATEQLVTSRIYFDLPIMVALRENAHFGECWEETFAYKGRADEEGSSWSILSFASYHTIVVFRKKIGSILP